MNDHVIGLGLFKNLKNELSNILDIYYKTEIGERNLCLDLLPVFEADLNILYFKKVRFDESGIYIFTDKNFMSVLLNSSIYDFKLFYTSPYNFLVPKDNTFCKLSFENFPELKKYFFLYHGEPSKMVKALAHSFIQGNKNA